MVLKGWKTKGKNWSEISDDFSTFYLFLYSVGSPSIILNGENQLEISNDFLTIFFFGYSVGNRPKNLTNFFY